MLPQKGSRGITEIRVFSTHPGFVTAEEVEVARVKASKKSDDDGKRQSQARHVGHSLPPPLIT